MKVWLFVISLGVLLCTSLVQIFSMDDFQNTAEASSIYQLEQVRVKAGDSLWKLANRYYDANEVDIWKIIDLIREENQLKTAYLYPGQTLNIPMDVTE